MRRVGVFGGTFDPIHIGHIHLCLTLIEKLQLSEVFCIPTGKNPQKASPRASPHDRYTMACLATNDIEAISVLDLEIVHDGPSYTIDTIRTLLERKIITSQDKVFLFLGEDLLKEFYLWKEVALLCRIIEPIVVTRNGAYLKCLEELKKREIPIPRYVEIPIFDLSATRIRKRLALGLYSKHLLHHKVAEYIEQHKLYLV